MNFKLKRPCSDCVFLKEGAIQLHPERRPGIIAYLLADDRRWFRCHQKSGAQCCGSMVYLLKADRPSVSMRLACAVGLLDFERLQESFPDVIDAQPPPDPDRAAGVRAAGRADLSRGVVGDDGRRRRAPGGQRHPGDRAPPGTGQGEGK